MKKTCSQVRDRCGQAALRHPASLSVIIFCPATSAQDISLKMRVDLPDLFRHAAATSSASLPGSISASVRDLAKDFRWLLKPLLETCPLPVHTDSLAQLVTKICGKSCYVDNAVATTLAVDLRWILTSLRKIRKGWKYAVKGKPEDWPKFASS